MLETKKKFSRLDGGGQAPKALSLDPQLEALHETSACQLLKQPTSVQKVM